jgi:hypothetical protein
MGGGVRAAAIALLVPLALAIGLMVESWPVTVDDAFISLRHARHWVEHGTPSFDASERIEAYSNFAWVAFGAAVLAAGGDAEWASKLVGALCAVGSILLTFALARRAGADGRFACLGAALVAVSSGLAFWAVSGMETAFFTLLLSAGVWRLLASARHSPWPTAGLFLLAALTRLEGPVLVAAAILAAALARWRDGVSVSRVVREYAWVGALGLGYALYFAWRWHYYGHLFPSPIYFKRVTAAGDVGASYGAAFLASSLPLIALAAAAPWLAGRRSWAPLAVVASALVVFATARQEVLEGVSTMAWLDRYFVPVLPCLAASAVAALEGASRRLGASAPRRAGVALTCAMLLLWQLGNPSANPARLLARTRGYPEAVAARGAPSAAYLQEHFGSDANVIAGDIGRLGYVFRGSVWDLFGLASYERTLHHGGALEPYLDALLARAPDAILLCFDAVGGDAPRPCQPAERVLTGRRAFRERYAVDAVFGRDEVPSAYHVVYRRREAPPEER